jgi:hypothetical protein
MLGPFKTIGSVSEETFWAHLRPSAASLRRHAGPIRDYRQHLLGEMLGPFETNSTTMGPLKIFSVYRVHSILGPSEQFGRYIYWAHSHFTSTFTPWAHVGFPVLFGLFSHGLLQSHCLYLTPLCAAPAPLASVHTRTHRLSECACNDLSRG